MTIRRSPGTKSRATFTTTTVDATKDTAAADVLLDLALVGGVNADLWALLFDGTFILARRCQVCRRPLTSHKSKAAGRGPVCAGRCGEQVMGVYGTSAVKRSRSTKSELAALETAIYEVCRDEHPLSIRGCFYRVMSAGLVPKTEQGYKRVQQRALLMRRVGALPYNWIADGTRWRIRPDTFTSAEQALADMAASYRRDLWHNQDVHVEIWSEKDAIRSVISSVTWEWDVPLFIARGFHSETFLHSTAQDIIADGKPAVIYQLGDHDPSGLSAWDQTKRKLTEFAPGVDFQFERLAVTPEQIAEYNLPTRPTKSSDSRSRNFTGDSVEVDAMPSRVLRTLVEDAVERWMDPEKLALIRVAEDSERAGLRALATGGLIGGAE